MCGFVVLMSTQPVAPDVGLLQRMSAALSHRGPDDAGSFAEGPLAIGFRRLAIFDTGTGGRQPMTSADGRYVIAFNGAIYNFIELRAELIALGHAFHSRSDTEVLLAAYQEWGRACLQRLNGMWAFVIYDRHTQRLFGARDRFGIKPLFWHRDARGLALASEIKALRDSGYASLSANREIVARFLLEERLDTGEETFYAGVYRVPAGTCFEMGPDGAIAWHRWWSLAEAAAATEMPSDPAAAYRELFDDAVRLRMRSDVPVGVLLSGGLDSTSIICRMAGQAPAGEGEGLVALCYRDPQFDEGPLIDATLRQTGARLRPVDADPDRFWDSLGEHLHFQDEPVHSFSSVASYELMRTAHEHGVKVVLNGQGADEVLGGYPSYFFDYWSELLRGGHPVRTNRSITAFARHHGASAASLRTRVLMRCLAHAKTLVPGYSGMAQRRRRARINADPWVSSDVKQDWRPSEQPLFGTLSEALTWSVTRESLPLYLRVEDRNAMAHGVEARLPFLDYRLVSLAFRLDSEWKLREASTKVVLRMAMRDLIPETVRTRVQKFGFPTSAESWFRGPLYPRVKELLASREVRESGLWNVAQLDRALERHRRNEGNLGAQLFNVVQVARWVSLSRL